jgi:hypothetical protein
VRNRTIGLCAHLFRGPDHVGARSASEAQSVTLAVVHLQQTSGVIAAPAIACATAR